MAEYRISADLYKRIEERKNKIILKLCFCAVLQLLIVCIYVFAGRDGIIIGTALELLLLYLVWKYMLDDIRSMTYKNQKGKIIVKNAERYIERSAAGGRYGPKTSRAKIKYTLHVSLGEDKILSIPVPGKDAFLSYEKDDEVMLVRCLPYPIITSRVPKKAVCPQCASILHYEDGACHECGLEGIYPDFSKVPKWERG